MNPLIEQHLKQIRESIEELRGSMRAARESLRESKAAYENLTQRYWSRTSKAAMLDRNEEDYQELLTENDRYRKTQAALRDRLERVLHYTKTLQDAFDK